MKKFLSALFIFVCFTSSFSQVVANFSGTPTLACVGQTVQFTDLSTGTPTMWVWTFVGGSPATSTLQNPAVTYSAPGAYNVTLLASNSPVPSSITKVNYITVIGTPTAGTISGPSGVCAGQTAMYSITSLTNATTYSWTVPTGASILSGQGTNSITVISGTTSGNVCVAASNTCGTGAASCLSVTVNPAPVVLINSPATSICSGGSTTLTASGASSYTFSGVGLSATTGSNVTASPTITTTYSVTGTSSTGCTGSNTIVITVNPNPTITVSPSAPSVCSGGSVTLTANGASTYTWSPPLGLNTTTGAIVVASPVITTTYTVTGTSAAGCIGSAMVTVTVTLIAPITPGPVLGSTTPCAGQTAGYSVLPLSNTSTYSWTVPTGAVILSGQGTNSVSVMFGAASGNICVTASNACGSSAASCQSVTPVAPPSISVTPTSTTICAGTSVTLTASGASTYSWSPAYGLNTTSGSSVIASPSVSTTYSVVGTSTSGCTGNASVNVSVTPSPTISITPSAPSICTSGSVTLVASGANTYSWSPATGLSSTSGPTVIASPTITTTYMVIGTSSTTGCQGSGFVTVTVTAIPPLMPGPVMGSSFGCVGQTTSYSVFPVLNASTYSWTVPSGITITSGQGTNSISVLSVFSTTGNICVTASNACGSSPASCTSVTTVVRPTISVTPSSTTICSGSSVTLTASGANSYSWSPSSSLSSTTGSSVIATPTINTTYSVVGTATTGCTNTATVNVMIAPSPTITITPNKASICVSGSVTLIANGANTYSWSPATGLNTTSGATVIASPTVTTTYAVTGTSTTGCSGSAVITVTVTSLPPATPGPVMGSVMGCIGQTGSYSVALVLNASTYSWTVPTGASILSGQGTNSVTIQFGASAGNICVTASNACGTSAASCLSVIINTPPSVSVTPTTATICAGSSVTLSASGAATYSWSPATGLTPAVGPTVIASPSVTTTYSVIGTSTNGCSNSATTSVIIGPSPSITVIPNAPAICTGGSVTLTASGATTYSWSPGTGLSSTSGSTVVASPFITTTYTVVGNSASLACTGSAVVTVSVSSLPPVSPGPVIGSPTVCAGQPSIYFVPAIPSVTNYSWTGPPGSTIVSGQGTNSITLVLATNGSGNLCVTASNACGTSASTCFSITTGGSPTVTIYPGFVEICSGSSATLTATGAATYSWSPSTSLNTTVGPMVIASPTITTTYTVTGTSTTGCYNTDSRTVFVADAVPASPVPITGPANVCVSQAGYTYSVATIPNTFFYNWTVPTGYVVTSGQSTTLITVASGTISGNICVTAANGCGVSPASCLSVTAGNPSSLSASISPATCTGSTFNNNGSITLLNFNFSDRFDIVAGSTYTGNANYSTAAFVPNSGVITNTLVNPDGSAPYTVRLFNIGGCTKDTTLLLTSANCGNNLFIPDVFTPDGDGKNDAFVITGLPSGIDNTFTVYNRWGSKVYSKSNYDNSWNGYPNVNGTLGTDKLLQGTYYYILEFKGSDIKTRNGFIALEY